MEQALISRLAVDTPEWLDDVQADIDTNDSPGCGVSAGGHKGV